MVPTTRNLTAPPTPWDIANSRFDLEVPFPKTQLKFYKKNNKKKVSDRIPPKFNQIETMTSFVAIGWAVLILLWGQGKMCPTSVAWWPWPKVTKMGTKKMFYTQKLTMCGLKKLASVVFPASWKVLAEWRRRRQGKRLNNTEISRGYAVSFTAHLPENSASFLMYIWDIVQSYHVRCA